MGKSEVITKVASDTVQQLDLLSLPCLYCTNAEIQSSLAWLKLASFFCLPGWKWSVCASCPLQSVYHGCPVGSWITVPLTCCLPMIWL